MLMAIPRGCDSLLVGCDTVKEKPQSEGGWSRWFCYGFSPSQSTARLWFPTSNSSSGLSPSFPLSHRLCWAVFCGPHTGRRVDGAVSPALCPVKYSGF